MKVTIDPSTAEILRTMMIEQNKDAIRIKHAGPACGGISVAIIADEQKENDEVVEDQGIKIVADKSISFFFKNAVISHTNGIYGPILKLE